MKVKFASCLNFYTWLTSYVLVWKRKKRFLIWMTFWKTKEFCGSWRCFPSMLVIQLRNWKTEGLIPQIFFDICTTPRVKSITLLEFGKLYNYFFGAIIHIEISIMDIFHRSVPIRMSSEWHHSELILTSTEWQKSVVKIPLTWL